MKFSRNWLSEMVELPPTEELEELLTFAGLAVEYVEQEGDDELLDIDVTTNRPDCMCHLGIAREIAALTGRPLTMPPADPEEGGEPAASAVEVRTDDPRCTRFTARIIRGVTVGPSPDWLARRLEAVGVRPISNVVDVTNYVLWETGQPLHAYDLATVAGPLLTARAGIAGESCVTLDGVEREVSPEILMIADAERAVGLGGIMGGHDTEVTDRTTDVLLEAAHFAPRGTRLGGNAVGLHTDARHRFERGADPMMAPVANSRAAALIAELGGGTVAPGVIDVHHPDAPDYRLGGRLELARLERFLGTGVAVADLERWLTALGFELAPAGDGIWQVTVPSWRYYDMLPTRPEGKERSGEVWEHHLFEEVVRMLGYAAVPSALPAIEGSDGPPTRLQRLRERVRRVIQGAGYCEAINYSFQSAAEAAALPVFHPAAGEDGGAGAEPLALENPLSERYTVMRRNLAAGLIEAARFNQRRGLDAVRLFELGRVFYRRPPAGDNVTLPWEPERVALVAGGTLGQPWDRRREIDFFDLKGVVEAVAESCGTALAVRPAQLPGLVPGVSAELLSADGGGGQRPVGFIGQVLGQDADPLFVAEIELAALDRETELKVETPSRFPGIEVDLTLTHPVEVSWSQLRSAVEELRAADREGYSYLESFSYKDRYQGEGVPAGSVNSTLTFFYNAPDRSLTQEEINERHEALRHELERRFGNAEGDR